MEEVCPDAWFLNYTNPMAMLTGAMQRYTGVKTVGLCHSVQVCCEGLLKGLGMEYDDSVQWKIAGINHQAWLLEVTQERRGSVSRDQAPRRSRAPKSTNDMVRYEIMKRFGYYVTESSEHNSEYMPYFIKATYPELIDRFNIPLDEYPRRCINQIAEWEEMRDNLLSDPHLDARRARTNTPATSWRPWRPTAPSRFGGNVINTGLITNLPSNACVEVPCMVGRYRACSPCFIGDLPEQCAAMNRTNINRAAARPSRPPLRRRRTTSTRPRCSIRTPPQSSPSIEIVSMCDDLIEAHKGWLPEYH